MLRAALFAVMALPAPGALAQDAAFPSFDFVLRPTQGAGSDSIDNFWTGDKPPPQTSAAVSLEPAPAVTNMAAQPAQAAKAPAPPVQDSPAPTRRKRDDADPFAATGIRLGPFVLRPAIEVGVNATDNPAGTARKRTAVGLLLAPEINIQAEDTRYKVEANAQGEAVLYGDREIDERTAAARVKARYALTKRTTLEAEVGYSDYLDRYNDPNTPAAAVERPPVHTFDATLGATERFGRFSIGLSGQVQREVHDDVPLTGGGTASLKDLNNTEYGLKLRTSYGMSGVVTPYVEAAAGRRDYDLTRDSSGLKRSALWGELRGGLAFNLGSKFNGEVAVGWRHEAPEDSRIADLNALTAAAAVIWSPRRLTEVRFALSTDVKPTSLAGSPGSVLYSATLTVTQKVTARLRLEAGLGLDYERFVDVGRADTTTSGFAGASYALNRFAALQARYSYERTDSTDPTANENANVIGVRVRLQH